MQAGRDMRQQQQQEAMGQQAQPQQPPMDQAPAPAPAPMAPPPMMEKGVVQGQALQKPSTVGVMTSPTGSLKRGGPAKKFFAVKPRHVERTVERDVTFCKAQKAEDKAALEGLSGKEKRQARRAMRQERRQENRALRKETTSRASRQASGRGHHGTNRRNCTRNDWCNGWRC